MPDTPQLDRGDRATRPDAALGGLLFDALMRDTTVAVAVIDAGGTMTMMSPALEELARAEFSPVEAHRIPGHFNVHSADRSRVLLPDEEPLNRARAGEAFHDEVVSLRRSDHSWVYLRCSGTPLRDVDGSSLGGLVLFTDVTAEVTATREQDLLRDRIVETFNHELRTPLTSLMGHAEILGDFASSGIALPSQAQRSLDAVVASGERLKALADAVSELVDLEGARRIARTPVDVVSLVERVVRSHRSAASGSISVVLASPGRLVAPLDEVQVARAVDAILGNAVHHAPVGTAVSVRVWRARDEIAIEVADQGHGIHERDRERLMQPFERGEVGLSSPAGRGLGLATTRAVATAHGGRLVLQQNLPQGLRAVIRLRVA